MVSTASHLRTKTLGMKRTTRKDYSCQAAPMELLRDGVSTNLLAVAAVLLSAGCGKKAPPPPPPPTVEVTEVKQQDVPIFHEWIGTLDGLVNAQIRAQVTGYLQTQNYTEGDPVKKEDLLFQIDPRPFEAEIGRAHV